jgi:xylulokinase
MGCSDQPAQAIGNGLVARQLSSVTIGTGGQVFVPLNSPIYDPRLHTFCHTENWYLLGAMLSAGMALRWFKQSFLGNEKSYAELDELARLTPAGSEHLYFLPYLVGERSPLMDPEARAGFIGFTLRHQTGHAARAVMEGVAFALRQILETMTAAGATLGTELVASGNGLGSDLWRSIVADILNRPLLRSNDPYPSERAAVGAAMLAGIGSGQFSGFDQISQYLPAFDQVTTPDPGNAAIYEKRYQEFIQIYPSLSKLKSSPFSG